jgi:hypothetical protein
LSDRSVADLLKQLSDQTATLVRQELDLVKAELVLKGTKAGLGAAIFGGAGVFGLYAGGALTACVIVALSTAMVGAGGADRDRRLRRDHRRTRADGEEQSSRGDTACARANSRERKGGRRTDQATSEGGPAMTPAIEEGGQSPE